MNNRHVWVLCAGIVLGSTVANLSFVEAESGKDIPVECSLIADYDAWNAYMMYYDDTHFFKIISWGHTAKDGTLYDCEFTSEQSVLEEWISQ